MIYFTERQLRQSNTLLTGSRTNAGMQHRRAGATSCTICRGSDSQRSLGFRMLTKMRSYRDRETQMGWRISRGQRATIPSARVAISSQSLTSGSASSGTSLLAGASTVIEPIGLPSAARKGIANTKSCLLFANDVAKPARLNTAGVLTSCGTRETTPTDVDQQTPESASPDRREDSARMPSPAATRIKQRRASKASRARNDVAAAFNQR